MLDGRGNVQPTPVGVDLFDEREAERLRRDFVADRMDAQTENLGPLPATSKAHTSGTTRPCSTRR